MLGACYTWLLSQVSVITLVATMSKHKKYCNLQTFMVISTIVSDVGGLAPNSQYSSTKRQLDELESSVLEEEAFSMT